MEREVVNSEIKDLIVIIVSVRMWFKIYSVKEKKVKRKWFKFWE